MDKRSNFAVLPAALLYFVLVGFTDGQFFPGKAQMSPLVYCVFGDIDATALNLAGPALLLCAFLLLRMHLHIYLTKTNIVFVKHPNEL